MRKVTFLTEGQVSKGGQNPPLEPGFKRPPPPQGSDGTTTVVECPKCGFDFLDRHDKASGE